MTEPNVFTTKKLTNVKIDPELWKRFKSKCVQTDMSISVRIEHLIEKDLKE